MYRLSLVHWDTGGNLKNSGILNGLLLLQGASFFLCFFMNRSWCPQEVWKYVFHGLVFRCNWAMTLKRRSVPSVSKHLSKFQELMVLMSCQVNNQPPVVSRTPACTCPSHLTHCLHLMSTWLPLLGQPRVWQLFKLNPNRAQFCWIVIRVHSTNSNRASGPATFLHWVTEVWLMEQVTGWAGPHVLYVEETMGRCCRCRCYHTSNLRVETVVTCCCK